MMNSKIPVYLYLLTSILCVIQVGAQSTIPGSVLVVQGGQTDISCLQGSSHQQTGVTQYEWKDSQGQDVSPSHFLLMGNGALHVLSARPEETGLYTCTAKTSVQQILVRHYLTVYRFPTISYVDEFLYEIPDACTQHHVGQVEASVKRELCGQELRCDFTVTSQCQEALQGMSPGVVWVKTLLQLPLHYQIPNCDMPCVINDMHLKLSQAHVILEQMLLSRVLEHAGVVSGMVSGSFKRTEDKTCPEGYQQYGSNICVACSPGHYKTDASEHCLPCATGFYQDRYGQSACKACSPGITTSASAANSSMQCIVPGSISLVPGHPHCSNNKTPVVVLIVFVLVFMAATVVLGTLLYRLRKKTRSDNKATSPSDAEEPAMKISPSLKSYFLNKLPIDYKPTNKPYVPLAFRRLSQIGSLTNAKTTQAERQQSSQSLLADQYSLKDIDAILPDTPVTCRPISQTSIFSGVERQQPLLVQVSKTRVPHNPKTRPLTRKPQLPAPALLRDTESD